ncbi:MAG: ketopantoate reductase C-terminal domain-containing protein [Elusimicrobia bacterium]|nr:ketopantoate reductase C-terminal domain-containing protein [Elusimicrobiota bacterium]
MRRPPPQDWTNFCAQAAVGGLCALAGTPQGRLADDPLLRRLLAALAGQAAAAARARGLAVGGRPLRAALAECRRRPRRVHPWLARLRRKRPTGAGAVLGRLTAARRGASTAEPCAPLAVVAATLRRLEAAR